MTKQAQNNINLCKGNSKDKIMALWTMGNVGASIISEIAEHYSIKNDRNTVAEYLSKL